jgi:outer membrane lipoprotein-sorting protein
MDKKALIQGTAAREFNRQIETSKGTGWISIKTGETTQTYRIIWAAAFPGKIRMTLLLSGLPVETMIATGQSLVFFSHTGRHSSHTIHSKDPDLKKYLDIPIKLSDIISVLLGRLPVTSFDDAYYLPADPLFRTLVLYHSHDGQHQYLHFDGNRNIHRISRINASGHPLYEIGLDNCNSRDFGRLYTKIKAMDKTGRNLTLVITRFIANPEIKASTFMLTEPG